MSELSYFNQIVDKNGYIYSVDGLRINFQINPHYLQEFQNYFIKSLGRTDIEMMPESTSEFRFRYLLNIKYSNFSSMTIGFVFNGSNNQNDKYKGFIDVNPNKTGSISQFWADFRYIKACSEDFNCVRCDVALDIPVKREMVVLEKDCRKYSLDAYSLSNKTEYLGRRSNVGFVKVYNKTSESSLDYDLTRIEVTCEPNSVSYFMNFPKVWDISQVSQLTSEWLTLSNTDLTILRMETALLSNGLDNGLMFFNGLGKDKKKKLKQFLLPEPSLVFPCSVPVISLFVKYSELLNKW